MVKRILVGLGGTPFTTVAVQRAVELAQIHDAYLTGVTVVELSRLRRVGPVPPGAGAYAKRVADHRLEVTRQRVDEAVAAFQQSCQDAGLRCSVEMETGDPFALMISHSRHHDVTVFGLRSLFDYGITPEPKNALIQLLSQGVRPIVAVSTQYRTVRKALVAYSGSMESAKAMRRFVQMRLWPDVRLEVVHFSTDTTEGKALLDAAADYCRAHGFETETWLADGDPEEGILERARQTEADIIVMGNSARSLMFRRILGDATLTTIQNADRPLFLAQ
jgi:nucleotide-binding universal stress UspA family protein